MNKDGLVSLRNVSSIDLTITNQPVIADTDSSYFEINTWYVISNADSINEPDIPIILRTNDVLWVDVKFAPTALPSEKRFYHAVVLYESYEAGSETSNLNGEGIVYFLAVDNNNNKIELSVFPNPINELCNINYNLENAGYVNIQLYNIIGNKINDYAVGYKNAGHNQTIINTESLPQGTYRLLLRYNGKYYSTMFVKVD